MFHYYKHIALFFIFTSFLLLTACANKKEAKTTVEPVKQLIIADVNSTATNKEYINHYYAGVYMALDEINKSGGVNGMPLKLIIKNDFINQVEAYNKAKEAVEKDKAIIVMGSFLPQTALGLARYAKDAAVPTLITGASTETIYNKTWANLYTFRLKEGYDNHIQAIAERIAKDPNLKTATVLTYTNSEGNYLSSKIKEEINKVNPNFRFAADIRISQGLPLAISINNQVYDSLGEGLIIALDGNDLTEIIKTIQETNAAVAKKVYALFAGEPEWFDSLGDKTPNGWVVTGFPWYSINTPQNKEFVAKYHERYKYKPRYASYLGYSAVYIVAQALKEANPQDYSQISKDKIRDALEHVDIITPMGNVKLRKDFRSNVATYIGILRPYNKDKHSGNTTIRVLDVRMFDAHQTDINQSLDSEEVNLQRLNDDIKAQEEESKHHRYIPLKQYNNNVTNQSSSYYLNSSN